MPARDRFHDAFRAALIKDGWTITDDPLHLKWGAKDLYVDLGAEQLVAAEKGTRKIAVEIKSFIGSSQMTDLERAVGQFALYSDVMSVVEPDRELFLAVDGDIFAELFEEPIGKLVVEKGRIRLIVFNPTTEEILQWELKKPSGI